MKNLKLYSIFGLSALIMLSACKKDEPTEDPNSGTEDGNPTITLSQTTLTVDAAGGETSVAYRVTNAVDGETISINQVTTEDWITVSSTTSTNINFTVEANSGSESRTATFTVSYPGANDVSLNVVQEAVVVGYDYEYELSDFTGEYIARYGYNGEDLFYIILSDLGFSNGSPQAGGHYYEFYLFVDGADGSYLPSGTYTYSIGSEDMTLFYYSSYVYQYSSGYDQSYLIDGYLNVSADGDTYTIEGVVTDENGAVHRVSYTGAAEFTNYAIADKEFTATTAVATYYTHAGDVMNVDLLLTDMVYDGTYLYPPGTYMFLDTYMNYDADGKITEGTYTVNTSYTSPSISSSYYSYVYYYENTSDYTYGYIASGTMTVEEGDQEDYYNITCEFVTDGGATVKCTYSGYLVVDDMPGPASTLTGDVTVNLEGAVGQVYGYGDYYSNGGSYLYVQIYPPQGGEGLFLDLNAVSGSTVPSGTYTASTTTTPAVGEYTYGYLYYSYYLMGSWYAQVNSSLSISGNMAPLVSGDINFTDNQNGTYTLEFECTDDAGYTIGGTWTGSLTDLSYYSASTSLGKRPAFSKPSKQEMSAKTAEVRAAKTKAAQSDNMKVPVSAKSSRTDAVFKTFQAKK